MAIGVKVLKRPKLNWLERLYLWPILKGLWITLRYFFKRKLVVEYPEEKVPVRWGYRGLHRLNKDYHGNIKCVACFMCATNCPSECIEIVAGEAPFGSYREKYPVRFQIDELECIFCGMCEEACPEVAIQLTPTYEMSEYKRKDFQLQKEDLMEVQEFWVLPRYSKVRPLRRLLPEEKREG
jgi:NADH-quinone oxidoreductase subunit I